MMPALAQEGPQGSSEKPTLRELAKEVPNPLSSVSLFTNEIDYTSLNGELTNRHENSLIWNLQPAFPMELGGDWLWVHRPVIPLVLESPIFDPALQNFDDKRGIGDI
jgi:hypothetical protein